MNDIEQRALERIMIRRGELPAPTEPPVIDIYPQGAPEGEQGRPPGGTGVAPDVIAPPAAPNAAGAGPVGPGGGADPADEIRPAGVSGRTPQAVLDRRAGGEGIVPGVMQGARVAGRAVMGAAQAVLDTGADVLGAMSMGAAAPSPLVGMASNFVQTPEQQAQALRDFPGVTVVAPELPRPEVEGEVANTIADLGTYLVLFATTGGFTAGRGLLANIGSGMAADFMSDPEQGGMVTLLRSLGVAPETLAPLDPQQAAAEDERIKARLLSVTDGAVTGAAISAVVAGIRMLRQNPTASAAMAALLAAPATTGNAEAGPLDRTARAAAGGAAAAAPRARRAAGVYPNAPPAATGINALREQLSQNYGDVSSWVSETPNAVIVNKIVVPEERRGQGVGSSFMREVIAYADAVGKPVALTPSADFGGSVARLNRWYQSLGFVPNTGRSRNPEISESMIRPSDGAAGAPPAEGIRAFHGTPHNVDRFDISKIGTGEGEQAFGHGLYFASRKDVAAGYRNALSEKLVGGRPVGELNAPDLVRRQLRWIGEDGSPSSLGDAAQKVRGFASAYEQYARRMRGSALAAERAEHMAKAAMLREAADWMEKNADLPITRTGNVYEVRIRTSPERLLDWDKPFSQQPQAVQSALLSVMEKAKVAHYGGDREQAAISMQAFRKNLQEFDDTGAMVQEQIVSALGQKGASTALRAAGIDGIQYLDGGSRSAGSGSYNYVVFNDELIEIVRRYGFVPVLVVGGKEIYPQQPSEGAPDGR